MDGKLSLKGAWSGHVNHLHFGGHQPYLGNGLFVGLFVSWFSVIHLHSSQLHCVEAAELNFVL